MHWSQNYDPLQNNLLSTLIAGLPVVVLLGSIALLKVRIHFSALLGLAVALGVALFAYGMPVKIAAAAAVYGAGFGLFPIGWIILNLIFLYQLTVNKGLFAVLRSHLANLAPDPRIQIILIAFSFGAFFEGAAGFGTPVAVTAAILIQLGFKPLSACGLSLIANTAPVAYGALGTPILTLAKVTGLDALKLSAMAGRQLPFFSVLVPFWVVWAFAGWRGMIGVWPAALVAGASFALPQFLVSNYHGPWLVDIVAAICSVAATALLLKFWRPKQIWPHESVTTHLKRGSATVSVAVIGVSPMTSRGAGNHRSMSLPEPSAGRRDADQGARDARDPRSDCVVADKSDAATAPAAKEVYPSRELIRAWMPWVLLSALVFTWGLPAMKKFLDGVAAFKFPVAFLHQVVQRVPPVAPPNAAPDEAVFTLNILSATGSGILVAAILSGLLMKFRLIELARIYWETLVRVRFSLVTIAAMLALGYVTKYSGTDATLGLALAHTGALYPFCGTLLGWLGVALTGSDTASNVLFGNLQRISSEQLGLSPILMCAANSTGGVMGKMVDAQSIVVASTATNWYGHEGAILRYVFFHSLALAALVGILVWLQANVAPFTQMVVP